MVETPGLVPTGAGGELRPPARDHREHPTWAMPTSHSHDGGEHRPPVVGMNAVRVLPTAPCGPRERQLPEEATKNVSFSLDDGGIYKGPSTNGILKNSYSRTAGHANSNGIPTYNGFQPQDSDGRRPNSFIENYPPRNFNNRGTSGILNGNELRLTSSNGDLLRSDEANSGPNYRYETQVTGDFPIQYPNNQPVNYVNRSSSADRIPPTSVSFSRGVNNVPNVQMVPRDVNNVNGDVNDRGVITTCTQPHENVNNEGNNHMPLPTGGYAPYARKLNANQSSSNNSSSRSSRHPSTCSGSAECKPGVACSAETVQSTSEAPGPGQNRDLLSTAPVGILRHSSRGPPQTVNPPEDISHARTNEDKEKMVRIDPKVQDLKERTKSGIGSSFMGKNKHRPFLSSLNHLLGHGLTSSKAAPVNQANTAPHKGDQQPSKDNSEAAEELRRAAAAGDLGKIQTLLGKPGNAAGALLVNSVDEGGSSAVLRAACEGRVQALKLLLRHGANVDHQDYLHGNTGLHEACWKGYSESCAVLAKARAHLHLKNKGGFAPLHLACQNGHNQSCRVLLLAGCDPNIKNNYGDTPLHTAARYGHAGVTRILLSAQADVHISNKNGDSCLHIAAAMGRRKLTKILLEAGAVQTGRNKQGETPQDIARRKQFSQILDILQHPPAVVSPEERLKKEREQSKNDGTNEKNNKRQTGKSERREKRSKREKNDSGTSSRDSSTRPKDKKKMRGEARAAEGCQGGVHWSPYGCHNYTTTALQLPDLDVDALPKGGLKAGEQYYVDLAGNVKKGPVAVGGTCYCAPLLKQVEHKLETDKVALMDHIDAHHEKLDKRIHSLEKKTHTHIHNLKQTVQHKICEGRQECLQRVAESATEQDARLAAHEHNLQQWVEKRLGAHDPALPPMLRRTVTRPGSGRWKDASAGAQPLSRSRSEEALTEAASDLNEPPYRGLRVLDHPTSMYNLHQEVDDEDTTDVYKEARDKPLQSSVGTVTERNALSDKALARSEDDLCNPDRKSLCVMEDSSDSEGEQEPAAQDVSSYRLHDGASQLVQGVEKLALDHPYYANTGAIPKSSACSLPESCGATKEIVRVDVHAPREPHSKWPPYTRYDPRNSRNYLYDVQEIEASYGNIAPISDLEQVRDSGCSEGSSQTDIGESDQLPYNAGHDVIVGPGCANNAHRPEMQERITSGNEGRQPAEGHARDQVKDASSHPDAKSNNHQHQIFTEYNKHYYPVHPKKDETSTYLDMDRYRIQQAVRRLYDGYLTDGRGDPRRNRATLENSLEHDSHNDSGYSTRMCTASQGPSPALSGASGVPDGSGSESRSGHSTSSPNTTVIAFPQGTTVTGSTHLPGNPIVLNDNAGKQPPVTRYISKNYTDHHNSVPDSYKAQYLQYGNDVRPANEKCPQNYNRSLPGVQFDQHQDLSAAGGPYSQPGTYQTAATAQQSQQRGVRNILDVITVGESSLV